MQFWKMYGQLKAKLKAYICFLIVAVSVKIQIFFLWQN